MNGVCALWGDCMSFFVCVRVCSLACMNSAPFRISPSVTGTCFYVSMSACRVFCLSLRFCELSRHFSAIWEYRSSCGRHRRGAGEQSPLFFTILVWLCLCSSARRASNPVQSRRGPCRFLTWVSHCSPRKEKEAHRSGSLAKRCAAAQNQAAAVLLPPPVFLFVGEWEETLVCLAAPLLTTTATAPPPSAASVRLHRGRKKKILHSVDPMCIELWISSRTGPIRKFFLWLCSKTSGTLLCALACQRGSLLCCI